MAGRTHASRSARPPAGAARGLVRRARAAADALRASRAGAVAIEFAIGFPIFLFLVYGLFEFSRVYWTQATLDYAVEEAARFAMVNPTAGDDVIASVAEAAMTGLDLNKVTTSANVSNSGLANVTATYRFDLVVPIAPLSNYMLQATIVMPVVQ